MSADVCLAAMTPASRAVCRGSPFATVPVRMSRRAPGLIVISPRARASRVVTALSPTSTIRAFPRASTCDSLATGVPLGQVERQALQRHGQVHALELHVVRHFQRAWREVENRLDAGRNHLLDHRLSVRCGHGDDGDIQPLLPGHTLQLADVVNRDPASRLVANLLVGGIEQRGNLEPLLPEAWIVRERETEVTGTHDGHAQMPVESEDLAEMPAQILDVIADSPNAELSEIREVLANLGGIQMELFRQRLRRDRLDTGDVELVQAAQIDGQAVGGQFRHLVGRLTPLVLSIHKLKWYRKVRIDCGRPYDNRSHGGGSDAAHASVRLRAAGPPPPCDDYRAPSVPGLLPPPEHPDARRVHGGW